MAEFALGGQNKDYDSKKSRGSIVNLYPEGSPDGSYRCLRTTDGLSVYKEIGNDPIRSDLLVNAGYLYFVSGTSLYRMDVNKNVTNLGTIGGSGRAKLRANSIPGNSQIFVLNGSGDGYVYQGGTLTEVTDPDFFSTSSVTILNERFWFPRDNTNEFFGSEVSDGTAYNPLTFANAEESPDNMVAVIAKKSALWTIGTETMEYWQSFDDLTLPLRKVKGASKTWGILAKDSLADVNENFAFLANDKTVRMVQGTQLVEISDLHFKLKVKGNGTLTYPGFDKVDDAIGFFVDGPVHSIYYLSFPTEGYTWGYDVKTGLSHERKSEGFNRWRANSCVSFNNKLICGDSRRGVLWMLDQNSTREDTGILRTKLVTPFVSYDTDATIPLIELDMEVAKTTDPSVDPQLIVSFTRDGGYTWINWGTISLGGYGQHRTRVPLRRFGRLVRNKDFGLKLETTDDISVQYYGAHIYPRMDM